MTRSPPPSFHRPLPLLAIAALLAVAPGCRPRDGATDPGESELVTEEVAPPPDVLVDPEQDPQERRRRQAFAGVLPEGFPGGLPVYPGATLVDQAAEGPPWVAFLVAEPASQVRERYTRRLRAAGWSPLGPDPADRRWRREAREVRVRVEAEGASTRIRIEY
ncbi:MAG TPA: hypothetical protein VMT16_09835 [Thermoanaerobaculia bacterium]|nr:hypothetical protein [Thermoanaerobaculia bacterium]